MNSFYTGKIKIKRKKKKQILAFSALQSLIRTPENTTLLMHGGE